MLFHSIEFAVFLPIVFVFYWIFWGESYKRQNILILIASYIFYGWWDWRFLTLLIISSFTDYSVGLLIYSTGNATKRKLLLCISLFINLGILGFFKYYNFFIESFMTFFATLGVSLHISTLQIVLPLGISFYTFQTLSYTIDIYRKQFIPTRSIINFFAFVSFFPQLVAGPIERAKHLLPQFQKPRMFEIDTAKDGIRQVLWGLFKKVVIADTCAIHADYIFANFHHLNSCDLILGSVFFAFQIYGDFSGYSDIAIGTAKLFGFRLRRNFALPYFSRTIPEFWQRWHISLSSWFRDYVYIPLGGNRVGTSEHIRNIILTFTLSGLWHGANWTFIVWGFLNALYYLPFLLIRSFQNTGGSPVKGILTQFVSTMLTFCMTLVGWICFRSQTIPAALEYVKGIYMQNIGVPPRYWNAEVMLALLWIGVLLIIEWIQRHKQHCLEIYRLPLWGRWGIYFILAHIIYMYLNTKQPFIYFQF